MRNLVYFSPALAHPVGGVKVIYRHVQAINALDSNDVRAQVFHWEQPSFACTWFDHQVTFKLHGDFNPATDFAVLPECCLSTIWQQFAQGGVRYAIFVQNGYLIGSNPNLSLPQLRQAYEKAALIFTISDDAAECVRLWVPECAHKIVPVRYAIDACLFHEGERKENLITYMPRKMQDHVHLVLMFLQSALPSDWRVLPIQGMSEAEVASALRVSKIFMSFCGFEGLPMPPAEAALCGNQVVGYTGQGALEYWDPALFTEVASGDIRSYVREVLRLVALHGARQRCKLPHLPDEGRIALEALKLRFSEARQAQLLGTLLGRVRECR